MKRDINRRNSRGRGFRRRAAAWMTTVLLLFTMLPLNAAGFAEETLERETYCGLEAHRHEPDCYDGDALVCGLEAHEHTPECYVEPEAVAVEPMEPAKRPIEVDLVPQDGEKVSPEAEAPEIDAPVDGAEEAPVEAEQPGGAAVAQEESAGAARPEAEDTEVAQPGDGDAVPVVEKEPAEKEPVEAEPAGEESAEAAIEENPGEVSAEEITGDETNVSEITEEIIEAETAGEESAEAVIEENPGEASAEETTGDETTESEITEEIDEAETAEEAPAGEAAAPAYPAMRFEEQAFNVSVSASAPEGAFPEGTIMRVSRVWDSDTLSDIRETVREDFVEVKRVAAVDISFYDAGGAELEPLLPIEVSIAVADLREEQSAVVVHVDDAGNAEIVDQTAAEDRAGLTVEMPAAGLSFEAEAFSIYAVVVTETLETRYIAADGETYSVRLTYGPEARIPAGAALAVREVTNAAYAEQAEAALPEGERLEAARFFDIAIVSDGAEIEPEAPVEVSIALDQYAEGQARAVHFEDDGGVTLIDAEAGEDGVAFSAERFSVYGLVYTVTVQDGENTFVISSKTDFALSELLSGMGVTGTVTAASLEASDDASLTEDGDDWLLTVRKPFTDVLALNVTVDGAAKTYTIASAIREWNITELLNRVTIYDEAGNEIGNSDDDSVLLNPDKDYKIRFSFAETGSRQFSDNSIPMYYEVPAEVDLSAFADLEQSLSIALDDGVTLDDNRVWYDAATRRIYVRWNTADAKKFDMLTDAANAEFTLEYWANISASLSGIKFNDSIDIVVEPDPSYEADAEKTGVYNAETGRVDYTVTVWADATASNLRVSDRITGAALSYADNLAVSVGTDQESAQALTAGYTARRSGNGFDLTIAELPKGQKAFITYSADVNYAGLTGMGTAGETGNAVTVRGTNGEKTVSFDLEGQIKYVELDKEIGSCETLEDGSVIVPWTITYNRNPRVSVENATIRDQITSGAVDTMEYITDDDGRPFTVKVYDRDNNLVDVINNDWENVVLGDYSYTYSDGKVSVNGQSWEWTVPGDATFDADGPFWYEISYFTRVSAHHILMQNATITNTVTEDRTHNHAGATYEHHGGTSEEKFLSVEKTALEVTANWTRWQVRFPRWDFDLVPAYLIDTHPRAEGEGGAYAEPVVIDAEEAAALGIPGAEGDDLIRAEGLKSGTITVDGEEYAAMEHVDVAYADDARTVFHFEYAYERDGALVPVNLNANGTGLLRKAGDADEYITLTYYTKNSYDAGENQKSWVDRAMDGEEGYPIEHTNAVELIANGQSVTDEATVKLMKPGFEKSAELDDEGVLHPVASLASGDRLLPVYKFTLTLRGVDDGEAGATGADDVPGYLVKNWFDADDNLVVSDTYDRYLRLLTDDELSALNLGYSLVSRAGGDDADVTGVSAEETGHTATFTVARERFRRGEAYVYAPVYTFDYYLTLDMSDDTVDMVNGVLADPENGAKAGGLANTAGVVGVGEDAFEFDVDLNPIRKSAERIGATEKYRYRIVVNPLGLTLNEGNPYRLTDTFENLSVDFSTMTITPDDGVEWIYTGNEGTFWIPDGKAVTLEYQAWPVGERGDAFTMTNTAEIMGYTATEKEDITLGASHSGSASVYRLQLLKYSDDDMSMASRLESVQFQLYELDANGQLSLMHYNRVEIEDEEGNVTVYHPDREPVTFTTDAQGMATVKLSMMKDGKVLQAGKQYYLREVEPPENHSMEDIYWGFVLSDVSDYTAYVYRTNDVMKVSNTSTTPALILRKQFDDEGDAVVPPYDWVRGTEFRIVGTTDDGTEVFNRVVRYSDFSEYVPTGTDAGGNAVNGEAYWCYRLLWSDADIEGATKFTVTELTDSAELPTFTRVTKVNDGAYTDAGDVSIDFDRQATDYTVTFTNRYTPEDMSLTLSKAWPEDTPEDTALEAKFRLYRDGEPWGDVVTLPDGDRWSRTISGLPRYDADGNACAWSVEEVGATYGDETAADAEEVAERFTVSVGLNPTLSVEASEDGDEEITTETWTEAIREGTRWLVGLPSDERGAATGSEAVMRFTNVPNDLMAVRVRKAWENDDDGGNDRVTFDLYRTTEALSTPPTEAEIAAAELVRADQAIEKRDDGAWPEVVLRLEKQDAAGDPYTYFAVEHSVAGFAVTYAVDADEETGAQDITMVNAPDDARGSLSVAKAVSGGDPDGTYYFTVTNNGRYLNASGALQAEEAVLSVTPSAPVRFEDIPAGSYTVTERLAEGDAPQVTVEVRVGDADALLTEGCVAEAVVTGGTATDVTITNTYKNGETDFTFGKLWRGPSMATTLVWPQGAYVDVAIRRRVGDGGTPDALELVYRIGREAGADAPLTAEFVRDASTFADGVNAAPELEILSAGKRFQYRFRLSGLPRWDDAGSEWTYFAVETSSPFGYAAGYGVVDGFSALQNGAWNDAHNAVSEKLGTDIIGNVINRLEAYEIRVPVKKNIDGRDVKADERYAFELTYTDDNNQKQTTTVTTTGGAAAWSEWMPVRLTDATVETVNGQYCIEAVLSYTVREVEPEGGWRWPLGVTCMDETVSVTEVIDIAWETREIVRQTRTVSYADTDSGSAEVVEAVDASGAAVGQVVEITNDYQEERWKLNLKKLWDDAKNQDGKRRTLSFTVACYDENGTLLETRQYDNVNMTGANRNEEAVYASVDVPKFIDSVLVGRYVVRELEIKEGSRVVYTMERLSPDTFTQEAYDASAAALNAPESAATVENRHVPEKVNIEITKIWSDAGHESARGPIRVTLYATVKGVKRTFDNYKATEAWVNYSRDYGATYGEGTVTLTEADAVADGQWRHTWSDLPKYAPGEIGALVTYTVEEAVSDLALGYHGVTYNAPSPADGETAHSTITNKFEVVSLEAEKKWADDGDRDGLRPGSVTFELSATAKSISILDKFEGTDFDVAPRVVGASGRAEWRELPKYDTDGTEIVYDIHEAMVPEGYEASKLGYTVTNTHEYEKTEISLTKTWAGDRGNQDGRRPDPEDFLKMLSLRMGDAATLVPDAVTSRSGNTLRMSLKAAGEVESASDRAAIAVAWAEITWDGEGDTYVARFGDLPKNSGGSPIAYSVSEAVIDGYSAGDVTRRSANAYALTNTRRTVSLTISKAVISDLAADGRTAFDFTVEADAPINGDFGDLSFENGVATVSLAHDQSVTATGLPTLLTYTVTEAVDSGFITTVNGGATFEWTPSDGDTDGTAAFTNTRRTADLAISKTVVSPLDFDGTHAFRFRITLADTGISGTYGDVTFENGVGEVRLSHNETATAVGLPTSLEYTVEELSDGEADYLSHFAPVSSITGVIGTDGAADFTNTRAYAPVRLLKVDASDNEKLLSDARFTLSWDGGSLELVSDESGALAAQADVADASVVAVANSGLLKLADGTYILKETRAPGGYKRLMGDITLTVRNFALSVDIDESRNRDVTVAEPTALNSEDDVITLTLPDAPGAEFPGTGGRGVALWYAGGAGLLILALCLMLKRRIVES